MSTNFRKCSISSPPPPYKNASNSSTDDDSCHVIQGAFIPWWCRNPTISKFASATNCFPSMLLGEGYSVQNQKYVRTTAATTFPSRPKTPKKADGAAAQGGEGKPASERPASRSASYSECPSCCNIRPPRPIAGGKPTCAAAASATEVNVSSVHRYDRAPCANAKRTICTWRGLNSLPRRRAAAAVAARGRRLEEVACCALCEDAHKGRKRRRAVVGAPARVRRDKELVSAQRLRFDTAEQIETLHAAVREEYANRIAIEYLLRLGELQLQKEPSAVKASRALRGYMKMRF